MSASGRQLSIEDNFSSCSVYYLESYSGLRVAEQCSGNNIRHEIFWIPNWAALGTSMWHGASLGLIFKMDVSYHILRIVKMTYDSRVKCLVLAWYTLFTGDCHPSGLMLACTWHLHSWCDGIELHSSLKGAAETLAVSWNSNRGWSFIPA